MAVVPIEVVLLATEGISELKPALALANATQKEFNFSIISGELPDRAKLAVYRTIVIKDFFDSLQNIRDSVRGYHPFLIAIVDSSLVGQRFSNLFGSHRAENGVALITTNGIPDMIVPSDRMAAYFLYYFARYSISFLAPSHRNHDDSRDCLFDRKIDKSDIVRSMRARALCDECRRSLISSADLMSASQFAALEEILAVSGKIINEGVDSEGRQRVFIGSSTEGLSIANKIQELLADDFSVVVWNQGTVFGLGTSTLEALEAAVLEYQFGIFVFTPDDQMYSRGKTQQVPRDNVLFELGMFIGKLGRRRAFAVHPRGIALATDLQGITTAPYNPHERNITAALAPVANRIREAVREATRQ